MSGTDSFRFESGDVLLVVDVINDFEHDDGDRLLESFRERHGGMEHAIAVAREAGIPLVYVNDDKDRWDSDAPALIRSATDGTAGAEIVGRLAPQPGDRVLLKHRYSAFDHTALDLLLERLEAERVVLVGAATEGCVVQTAIDAREHGLKATILVDACATTDADLEQAALRYAVEVVGVYLAHIGYVPM